MRCAELKASVCEYKRSSSRENQSLTKLFSAMGAAKKENKSATEVKRFRETQFKVTAGRWNNR
jgi:hypothetical protein